MRLLARSTSLTSRLFFASAVLLPLLLWFSGAMLHHAYQRSLRASERDALRGQIYVLLGAAEPAEEGVNVPATLPDPRYSSVNSGLVGWVVDSDGVMLWRSRSGELILFDDMPKADRTFLAGAERYFSAHVDGQEFYVTSYDTLWNIGKQERELRFLVMQSRQGMYNELKAFRIRLWRWLGILAVLMVIVQTAIARWGLFPLRKLATDLEKVESGSQEQLLGRYPADIQPVTDNLNRVLKSERTQRERYRNTLSDLAHSLKTPLAVIRGQLEQPEHSPETLRQLVDEQVSRMSAIVDHQLRRANAQVSQAAHYQVSIKSVVERLVGAMQKVYQSKGMRFQVNVPEKLHFVGDEADLMELVGNVLDNSCKYGGERVRISAQKIGNNLQVMIEDDGPGVSQELKTRILTRGTRADTVTPGQGIGLAVVVDILSSYGGNIDIVESNLGGAGFKLIFPHTTS